MPSSNVRKNGQAPNHIQQCIMNSTQCSKIWKKCKCSEIPKCLKRPLWNSLQFKSMVMHNCLASVFKRSPSFDCATEVIKQLTFFQGKQTADFQIIMTSSGGSCQKRVCRVRRSKKCSLNCQKVIMRPYLEAPMWQNSLQVDYCVQE